MNKDLTKKIKRGLTRFAFYFFTTLFKVLPYWVINKISDGLLKITYAMLKRMRKNAMETLNLALGQEKSPEELEEICRKCFFNLGRGFVELAYFVSHPWMFQQKFSFRGRSKEYLEAALKEGKGVILVTAHFGNFSSMFAFLAKSGYPTNAIMRPSRDQILEKSLVKLRDGVGLKTIHSSPKITCVTRSLKALRANELLIIALDQNHGSKAGVFVEFFGRESGTATGPVIFAMRTGAPMLPIFTVRTGLDTHEVITEPHFFIENKSTEEETIHYNIQKLTSIIEKYIRRYPEEWGWMHRRWKSQPKTEESQGSAEKSDIL